MRKPILVLSIIFVQLNLYSQSSTVVIDNTIAPDSIVGYEKGVRLVKYSDSLTRYVTPTQLKDSIAGIPAGLAGTGLANKISIWESPAGVSYFSKLTIDTTNQDMAFGSTTADPAGLSDVNKSQISLVGKATANTESHGQLNLLSNKPIVATGDVGGRLVFGSINNNNLKRLGYIEALVSGSGGINGYGADMYFYTKADNGGLSSNMILKSGGGVFINPGTSSNAGLQISASGSTNSFYTAYTGSNSPVYIFNNGTGGSSTAGIHISDRGINRYGLLIQRERSTTTTNTLSMIHLNRSASNASGVENGAFITMKDQAGSAGTYSGECISYTDKGSVVKLNLNPNVSDGATSISNLFDTKNTLTSTAKLVSFKNAGTEKLYIQQDGAIVAQGNIETASNIVMINSRMRSIVNTTTNEAGLQIKMTWGDLTTSEIGNPICVRSLTNRTIDEAGHIGAILQSNHLLYNIGRDFSTVAGANNTAIVYTTTVISGTSITVNMYKEIGRSTLIATGNRTGDGVVSLSASGGSGVTASITVAINGATDGNYDGYIIYFLTSIIKSGGNGGSGIADFITTGICAESGKVAGDDVWVWMSGSQCRALLTNSTAIDWAESILVEDNPGTTGRIIPAVTDPPTTLANQQRKIGVSLEKVTAGTDKLVLIHFTP